MSVIIEQKAQLIVEVNVGIQIVDARTEQLLDEIHASNLVTLSGRNLMRDLLQKEPGITGLSHLAVGTNNATPITADTVLGTEVFRNSITKRSSSDGFFNVYYYLSSTQANGNTLKEAGLFNASSGGSLFARVTHDNIVKTTSIAATYNWQVNISAV